MTTDWTQAEAVALCKIIERVAPHAGCHVALTGGCLYKDGVRKDLDLIFYRIRQSKLNVKKLLEMLVGLGFAHISGGGWRYVGYYSDKKVDLLFPETPEKPGDDYPNPR